MNAHFDMVRHPLLLALGWWTVFAGVATQTFLMAEPVDVLVHGRQQMERLLQDRPFARYYRNQAGALCSVTETDEIYQWAARRFAGKKTGEIVVWNADLPMASPAAMADNTGSSTLAPAYLRMSPIYRSGKENRQYVQFEMLWLMLVFELNNVGKAPAINDLLAKVHGRTISREEFIWEAARLEYRSAEETREFYLKTWMPWCSLNGFKSDDRLWKRRFADSFEDWVDFFKDTPDYPWAFFGDLYDREFPAEKAK